MLISSFGWQIQSQLDKSQFPFYTHLACWTNSLLIAAISQEVLKDAHHPQCEFITEAFAIVKSQVPKKTDFGSQNAGSMQIPLILFRLENHFLQGFSSTLFSSSIPETTLIVFSNYSRQIKLSFLDLVTS